MLHKIKQQSFARLFDELDSDQDNLISRYCLNINALDMTMKNILNPIITELKQENETLNKDEFIKTMCHMYEMLNMDDRNYLISYYRNKNKGKVESHTRQTSLSSRSKMLSANHEKKMMRSISEISIRNNSIDSSTYFKQNYNNSHILDGNMY